MPTFDLGYPPSRHRSRYAGYDGTSLQAFFSAFPDDDACLAHLFAVRFGPGARCPRCGRTAQWRRHPVQKHYFHSCGGILSPMEGVFCSRTHIPLQLWFYAFLHFANSPESIPAPFLARQLGISEPTAFRVAQRIRLHMALLDQHRVLGAGGADVVVQLTRILRITNERANAPNRTNVLTMCDATQVRSVVIDEPSQRNLRAAIAAHADGSARIVTDCAWTFQLLSNYTSGRPIARFVPDYFTLRSPNQNLNHGFLQYFNLSFKDQFRGVSISNSWLYFKEYEFRYNRRHSSASTFIDLISAFPSFADRDIEALKAASFIATRRER